MSSTFLIKNVAQRIVEGMLIGRVKLWPPNLDIHGVIILDGGNDRLYELQEYE